MAAKIRLKKTGRRGKNIFRIVVVDESKKRDGKVKAEIGFIDASVNPPVIKYDDKALKNWMKKGASLSEGIRKKLNI